MSSLRRIVSSRANGLLSHGPQSPEGKRRSSQNAIRHGLLSECVDPVDGVEFGMIEEMAAAYWRLRRSWAIENNLLAEALSAQPPGDDVNRITTAFRRQAASAELALLHR